ncbi:MAG: PAS domain S-box protein [Bacillota bacterium]
MINIFQTEKSLIEIYSILFLLGLILFLAAPHLSLAWRGVFSIILIGLGAYFGQIMGGIITAGWAVFSLEYWGYLARFNDFALLTQGLVFGFLFKYQFKLKENLKQKSENLKKEKEMLDKILETIVDGFFMLDKQGDFIRANQAYQQMVGYSEEELLKMNISEISNIETKEEAKQHIAKVIEQGQDRFESQQRCKNGEIIDLEVSTTYSADINGGVFVVLAHDITKRKKKEERLKMSEAKFKSYINNAPYGVFVFNKYREYIELNPKALELSGYSKAEILNKKIGNTGNIIDINKVRKKFKKLIEQGEVNGEFEFLRKDGTQINVEVTASEINENRYIGFAKDISQRKKIEQKIKNERDKLKKYFATTEAIVLRLDSNKRIKEINCSGCRILGYSKEELIGKDWFDNFIKEEERERVEYIFDRLIEKKELLDGENKIVTKSGVERNIFWHNNLLTNEQGEVTGTLSTGIDITEVKSLREELEYSRLQMQFFANLSHELKTPLNLIFSAQQMIELEQEKVNQESKEKIDKYLTIISQNGNRLLRLVNNLLDINKFEANSFQLDMGNYDLVKIVERTAFSVESYIEQKQRDFEFDSELEELIIACDPFNLERVLLNLLSNAIKFTDEDDEIKIKVRDLGEHVRIIVSDTGIGIPDKKQEQIFKRFRQADKSFNRNTEGTGIGLSISRLIIELHGGEIIVESKVGQGSKFIIELPINKLNEEVKELEYYKCSQQLIERINIEFSDIYN